MELAKTLSSARKQVLLVYDLTEDDVNIYKTELRNWLIGKRHLPVGLLKDDLLERFLLRNKFSIEKTKIKIENYCTLRSKHMIFYENYEEIVPSKEIGIILPLFKLTDDLKRIVLCKILNEQKFNFLRGLRTMILMLELGSRMDYSCGDILVLDFAEMNASLITKINILHFRNALNLLLKAYPARMLGIHIINGSKVMNVLMSLIKPILPTKIYDRIHIHSSCESLHEILPKKCLPLEYGGEMKSLREMLDDCDLIFQECQDLFEEAIQIKSNDEKMRTANFPPEGTFRKLQID